MNLAYFRTNNGYDIDLIKSLLSKDSKYKLVLATGTDHMEKQVIENFKCKYFSNIKAVRNEIDVNANFNFKEVDFSSYHFLMSLDLQDRYELFDGESSFSQRHNLSLDSWIIWKHLIESYNIDVIIFNDLPHTPYEILIDGIAKKLGIRVVIIETGRIAGFVVYRNHMNGPLYSIEKNDRDILKARIDAIRMNQKNKPINESDEIYHKYKKNGFLSTSFLLIANLIYPFNQKTNNNYFIFSGKSYIGKRAYRSNYLKSKLRTIVLRSFYKKLSSPIQSKYIFLPLQFYFENSAQPGCYPLSNIEWLVGRLVKSLPKGVELIIKEHPAQLNGRIQSNKRLPRTIDFYKKITSYSNVKLVDLNASTFELIKNSEGVIVGTGSVTFEALILKKPILSFGNNILQGLPELFDYRDRHQFEEFLSIVSGQKKNKSRDFEKVIYDMEKFYYFADQEGLYQKDFDTASNNLHEIING